MNRRQFDAQFGNEWLHGHVVAQFAKRNRRAEQNYAQANRGRPTVRSVHAAGGPNIDPFMQLMAGWVDEFAHFLAGPLQGDDE